MKNLKITTVFTCLMGVFVYGVSVAKTIESDENIFCDECFAPVNVECNAENNKIEGLEFPNVYRYNSNQFTACHFNGVDSEGHIKSKIDSKLVELQSHEDHLHEITHVIMKQHKNMIINNTKTSFNYVVQFDHDQGHQEEVIDYGIKLKLK